MLKIFVLSLTLISAATFAQDCQVGVVHDYAVAGKIGYSDATTRPLVFQLFDVLVSKGYQPQVESVWLPDWYRDRMLLSYVPSSSIYNNPSADLIIAFDSRPIREWDGLRCSSGEDAHGRDGLSCGPHVRASGRHNYTVDFRRNGQSIGQITGKNFSKVLAKVYELTESCENLSAMRFLRVNADR